MHKHLQATVHNISVASTKTLRFDKIDDGLFNDYECKVSIGANRIRSIHTVIYVRNSRKMRFLRRFQKLYYFECTFFKPRFREYDCPDLGPFTIHIILLAKTQPCLISPVVGTSKQRNTQ